MINIVTFKWKRPGTGMTLPEAVEEYTVNHINILYNSIKRNTTVDFKFTCVTDDPVGLSPEINYVPIWNKCIHMGGCYNRLYTFSKDMKNILGDRFLCIDIDTVITGNIDHILTIKDEFAILEYGDPSLGKRGKPCPDQHYNGGLFMMNAGARSQVWDDFDFERTHQSLEPLRKQKRIVGSDQAWISHKLGPNETKINKNNGCYYYLWLKDKNNLPSNCAMVSFAGNRDPSTFYKKHKWIQDNWR